MAGQDPWWAMNRTVVARLLRVLLVACVVTLVLVVVAEGSVFSFGYGPIVVLLPFLAMGALALGLALVLPRIDAAVQRLTHHREITPWGGASTAPAVGGGDRGVGGATTSVRS